MGRIKSAPQKKAARQLLQNENAFTEEFDNNKKLLIGTMTSKSVRNKIAGYISRLIVMKNHPRVIKEKPKEEVFKPRSRY